PPLARTNSPAGRYSNSPWGWTPWTTGLVRAADPAGTLGDPAFPPNPYAYKQDWLNGGGQVTQYFDYLVASVYQPAATNPPGSAFPCPGCNIQYSYVDPSNLTIDASTRQVMPPTDVNAPTEFSNAVSLSGPMPPNRTSGWGQTPPPGSVPAISWTGLAQNNAVPGTPVGGPTDGPILRMLSKYNQATNPQGLQMPQYGDYTPLTGSLKNAYDYIQGVIATDPYANCGRNYYVMLLTDGDEQPNNLGNDPVAAVTALRSVPKGMGSVDVKTFVIGFGVQSPQLDQMARAGGTSVAPDLETLDPNGGAFDASTPDRLLKSLEAT